MFLVYSRLSTKEGLFTETTVKDQDIRFGKYNKDLYRECEWCYQVFEIEKAFKENALMCNECYKLLKMEDIGELIAPKIYIYFILKTRNIESVQTLIDTLERGFLVKKMLKVEQEKCQEKLLVFI